MDHSAAQSTPLASSSSSSVCLGGSNGDGDGVSDEDGRHDQQRQKHDVGSGQSGVLSRLQDGITPPRIDPQQDDRRRSTDSRHSIPPAGSHHRARCSSWYSAADTSCGSDTHGGAPPRGPSSPTQQGRPTAIPPNTRRASDVISTLRSRTEGDVAHDFGSAVLPLTRVQPSTLTVGKSEVATDPAHVVAVDDDTTRAFLVAAVSGGHATSSSQSPSPSVALQTPSSTSLRSPTPLDLTAPPKRWFPHRRSYPADRRSEDLPSAATTTTTTSCGGVGDDGGGAGRSREPNSFPSAVCNDARHPRQYGRAASSVPSCGPLHTAEGSVHNSDLHRDGSAEDGLPNTRRLSFNNSSSGTAAAAAAVGEERCRSNTDKDPEQGERKFDAEADSAKESAVTSVAADDVVELTNTPPFPPAATLPAPNRSHGASLQPPSPSSPLSAPSQVNERAEQRPASPVVGAAASTRTATPCSSSSPTPEHTPGRALWLARHDGDDACRSPSPRVEAAGKSFMTQDEYRVPVTPRQSNVIASARKKMEQGNISPGQSQQQLQQYAPQPTTPSLSHDPLGSFNSSFEGDVPEEDSGGGAASAVPRFLAPLCSAEHNRTRPSPPPLAFTPVATPAMEGVCVPQVVPTHESVFFPLGTEVIAPVMLHYVTVGGWSSRAGGRDYFNHRRLRGGEVAGHTVRWLHTAQPRDRFVFLVTPVVARTAEEEDEEKEEARRTWALPRGAWKSLRRMLFGEAPWFTADKTACGARSRIAYDDAPHSPSSPDKDIAIDEAVSTPSGVYASTPHSFLMASSVGGAHYHDRFYTNDGGDGASPPPLHYRTSHSVDAAYGDSNSSSSNYIREGEAQCNRTVLPSGSMSPMLVTRQSSQGGVSAHATPARDPAQADGATLRPSPLSLGHTFPPSAAVASTTAPQGPHLRPTGTSSQKAHPHGHAPPSPVNGPLFPLYASASYSGGRGRGGAETNSYTDGSRHGQLRHSATTSDFHRGASGSTSSGRRFIFSPLTGTAVSTSGVSPVTPQNSKYRTLLQQQQQQQQERARTPLNRSPSESTLPDKAAPAATVGVEVIEIVHTDITAMDYAPRLASHRLSMEAREIYTYFFPTLVEALAHYQCPEAMTLMEEQWAAGMTSQIPRPQDDAVLARQRHRQLQQRRLQQQQASQEHRNSSSSIVPTPSLTRHPSLAAAHGDGDVVLPLVSSSGNVSSAARSYEWASPPQHASQRCAPLRRTPLSSPPQTLASALRNAGRSDGGGGGGGERPATAPMQLFQPDSLPSFDVETEEVRGAGDGGGGSRRCHRPRDSDAVRPSSLPACATLTSTAAGTRPGSCSPPPRSRGAPALSNCVATEAPMSTSATTLPPTPLSGATHALHDACSSVTPKLTSTHREIVVSIYTTDPVFNSVLREVLMPEPGTHPYTTTVAEQKRLLSMVEVGMPAWAIFYSSTGLPYRRLFRLLYSGLTNLWPLLSLAVGVYDLYKHLPQLKRFMARTLDPLTRWLERRFTLRLSVLVTYLFSVVVTIFSSLSAFVSQFYVVQLLSLPIVQLVFALIKLPFVLAFDTLWLFTSTAFGTISLVLQLIRVVVMAPLVFVTNLASLRETVGVVAPVAVQGTSLSVRWWKAWSEFWETVASPMKNAVQAWWDSMIHVSTSAARRETSIRRWYTPKLEQCSAVLGEVQDTVAINTQLWWTDMVLPGLRRLVVLGVALVYLYWLFLGISDKVWDDFIYASGVRHPSRGGGSSVEVGHQPPVTTQQRGGAGSGAATDDEVTPSAVSMYVLFQSPFDLLCAARTRIITSITSATITASSIGDGDCATAATHAVFYTPTSVIHMCDSTGTSTITTTTARTAAAVPGASPSTTLTTTTTTVITTVVPLPQASLTSLAAELLLPNVVLELLHRLSHFAYNGWGAAADLAGARRGHLFSAQHHPRVNSSAFDNHGDLPDWACTDQEGGCQGGGGTHVSCSHSLGEAVDSASVLSAAEAGRRQYRMRRYAEEHLALVTVDVRKLGGFPVMQPTWAEVTYLRRGDTRGQETPRELSVVHQDDRV
ncbi:hypothetical protein ABB37_08837 [Leptomonas pyrrhocoris]|uniref:Transmembrane protein n=1 Tax=Leptomonas pyrrhocoris TaxID=157538 RepID=A0A0M9FSJ1_LEPPY|nr:hypothetical protein ABB37_08837 [Leptomonas pyrrhocoris]KPA75175.1 hypothetical protein ABB37_08837 [Leptomonas pyrrhocoris]|eukprot:XP_015653614.1 hypothetical protein ABB37_08837 [Leptomonas pyrrhocoris]